MPENTKSPFTFNIIQNRDITISEYDNHIVRRLSAMVGQYLDQVAHTALLEKDDPILYEVYEVRRPEIAGELFHGLSIVHPGKVGDEYFMTKGHFHSVLDTAEVYQILGGEGYMVMETPEGEWSVEQLQAGTVLYVPPCWAHRSINTSPTKDLVMFFVYPGDAGHDYGSIEKQGFRKLILEFEGKPKISDNPRWLPPKKR
jgi:glucose-6-phosphate isomerase